MGTNNKIVGGPTTDYIELYRYTKGSGPQIPYRHWTTFRTDDVEIASRMTKVLVELISHRLTIRVNRKVMNELFVGAAADRYVAGVGTALEYQNKEPIGAFYIQATRLKPPQKR